MQGMNEFSLLPVDLIDKCCGYLCGRDLTCVLCVNRELHEVLTSEEQDYSLWRHLYTSYCSRYIRHLKNPRFPNAQSWRLSYYRIVASNVLLVIRSFCNKNEYVLVVPRSMSLFGLKREVRALQLKIDGVEIEDFELVDADTGLALGIKGNDSLPPPDLGFLFISRERILQSTRATQIIGELLQNDYRPAWRKSLMQVPDGLELCQRFVTSVETSEDSESKNDLAGLVESLHNDKRNLFKVYSDLESLLAFTSNSVGYNGYKLYWQGRFHPLISVATCRNPSLGAKIRVSALVSFGISYVREIMRPRFLLNILVRATISNGFFLAFARLLLKLIPLLVVTQLKQIIDAEIDWVPVLFAIRFSLKVLVLTIRSILPVVAFQGIQAAVLLFFRLLLTKESPSDSRAVSVGLMALEVLLSRERLYRVGRSLKRVVELKREESVARFCLEKFKAVMVLPHSSFGMQYVLSDIAWSFVDKTFDPSLTISLPIYAYAVPFFCTMCLVKLRMSISDSYYCVLYL